MKRFLLFPCFCLALIASPLMTGAQSSPPSAEEYPLTADSQRQPGVPQGKVTKYTWTSKIFPGTVRDYYVYVPAQYTPQKPACVMLFEDGKAIVSEDGRWRIPIVFDNLIAKHEMPVTIAILIDPGVLKDAAGKTIRVNRSYEYDSLSDRYARFLLEEILPEVAKSYNLSKDPNDRAISGGSSGGICSFTVAWTHPEAFHRVLSFIGSFADLRGGDIYPALIRKTEPKPLRVFLQDGNHDLNIFAGDWWLANQSMASALAWAGYDYKFVTGDKDHDMIQGGAVLPDALRWLWRDYPQPITKPPMKPYDHLRTGFLGVDSDWEVALSGGLERDTSVVFPLKEFLGIASDQDGNVFVGDPAANAIYRIGLDGHSSTFMKNVPGVNAVAIRTDGQLYFCDNEGVATLTSNGVRSALLTDFDCSGIAVAPEGGFYIAGNNAKKMIASNIAIKRWVAHVRPSKAHQGKLVISNYDRRQTGGPEADALCVAPDQSMFYAVLYTEKWVWSYQIEADGGLDEGEPFIRLETTDDSSETGASGMAMDSKGLLYVVTRLGIQICDAQGSVVAILAPPEQTDLPLSGIAIGGPDHQYLYAIAGDQVFRRHLIPKPSKP